MAPASICAVDVPQLTVSLHRSTAALMQDEFLITETLRSSFATALQAADHCYNAMQKAFHADWLGPVLPVSMVTLLFVSIEAFLSLALSS